MFEKTSNFRLKLGFKAFSLSIFRITLRTSSVFRLSISPVNFDWEICSLHHRTTCLYDFKVKVNENQIDANFIALGIYFKLSNKWTKELALQDWFLRRQWIKESKFLNRLPDTIQYKHKEKNVLSRVKASNCTFCERRTVLGPTGLDQFFLSQNVQFEAYILYIYS